MTSGKKDKSTSEIRVASYTEEPLAVTGSFFNGLELPQSAQISVYKHSKRDDYALYASDKSLDYNGSTDLSDPNEYVLAVYDPVNKLVDLIKSPLLHGQVTARNKRSYSGPAIKLAGSRSVAQRKALGEAFGTKKAKKAITDNEKNRIDADKLQSVEMDIVDLVLASTADIPLPPTETAAEDRPTPTPQVDATNVEDIYPIDSIIPRSERACIRVESIVGETDPKSQLNYMPYTKSAYVAKNLPAVVAAASTSSSFSRLELVYYAALLFGVYENRRVNDKQTLMTRLEDKPAEELINGILDRFTIARSSTYGRSKDRSFVIDPFHESKLLCYLLILILHINNFMVEVSPLANELNLKPRRLAELFRAIGATIKPCTITQAEAFGIPRSTVSTYKIASLKVPFKVPEMARRIRRSK